MLPSLLANPEVHGSNPASGTMKEETSAFNLKEKGVLSRSGEPLTKYLSFRSLKSHAFLDLPCLLTVKTITLFDAGKIA